MKPKNLSIVLTAVAIGASAGVTRAQPMMGTGFTYQGQLKESGTAHGDPCEFQFSLWDAVAGGSQMGSTLEMTVDPDDEGKFTVMLDFAPERFTGKARWLQIAICCQATCNPGDFVTFAPRQELTPTPHAMALPGLYTQENPTSPNVIGGYSGNEVLSGAYIATISGGGQSGVPNRVTDHGGTIGGGHNNRAGDDDPDPANAEFATVSGGGGNIAGGTHATIGGGEGNNAYAAHATVGGGTANNAGWKSTVAGGEGNVADSIGNTIGGGSSNNATGGAHVTIAGGNSDLAQDTYATVGGGSFNWATEFGATVPGGQDNVAGGAFSLAAGFRAKVRNSAEVGGADTDGDEGTFVWADRSDINNDFTSTGPNQFLIRSAGGVGIGKNDPAEQLDVGGTVQMSGFKLTTAPSAGYVLTSDAAGVGTWQAAAAG